MNHNSNTPVDETLMAFAEELAAQRRAEGPLLVVVDDLPQLDALSVAVLAQLAIDGAITLLATARDGEPLPEPMVALWTSDRGQRIAPPAAAIAGAGQRIVVAGASIGEQRHDDRGAQAVVRRQRRPVEPHVRGARDRIPDQRKVAHRARHFQATA